MLCLLELEFALRTLVIDFLGCSSRFSFLISGSVTLSTIRLISLQVFPSRLLLSLKAFSK